MDYNKIYEMIDFLEKRHSLFTQVEIGEKASEEEVLKIENEIGYSLPTSFRKVLTDFAKSFELYWEKSEEFECEIPETFESGYFSWDLDTIPNFDEKRIQINENFITGIEEEYDRLFLNKLPLMELGNGDYVCFDLLTGEDAKLSYFSHENIEYVGYHLAINFDCFLEYITRLGFISTEYFDQFSRFTIHEDSGIIMDLDFTKKWIEELKNIK